MRPPRVKCTVRQMIMATAVIASLLWVTVSMRQRSDICQQRADAYAWLSTDQSLSGTPEELLAQMQCDDWAKAMEKKYRRAARYPWLSVEPDTAPPSGIIQYQKSRLRALRKR